MIKINLTDSLFDENCQINYFSPYLKKIFFALLKQNVFCTILS